MNIDLETMQPVNEDGKVLTTEDIELMMNLIDLLFLEQDKGTAVPS